MWPVPPNGANSRGCTLGSRALILFRSNAPGVAEDALYFLVNNNAALYESDPPAHAKYVRKAPDQARARP